MNIDPKELELGMRIENEHAKDNALARKLAMRNLNEDAQYYTKLKQAGVEETDVEECAPCGCGLDTPHQNSTTVITVGGSAGASETASTGTAEPKLTSSGLGKNGQPKPLSSTKLAAPETKKVGANKIATSKTPSMPGAPVSADPIEHFGSALVNLAEGGSQIKKK
jgi:hypothetical protein